MHAAGVGILGKITDRSPIFIPGRSERTFSAVPDIEEKLTVLPVLIAPAFKVYAAASKLGTRAVTPAVTAVPIHVVAVSVASITDSKSARGRR